MFLMFFCFFREKALVADWNFIELNVFLFNPLRLHLIPFISMFSDECCGWCCLYGDVLSAVWMNVARAQVKLRMNNVLIGIAEPEFFF